MQTKEGLVLPSGTEEETKRLLINMVYKLLPIREEEKDWEKYLNGCLLEIHGMNNIFEDIEALNLVRVLSKLESLKLLTEDSDFYEYRRTILECTNLID